MKKIINYLKGARRELSKVTWPSRKESTKLTIAVVVFTLVFVLFTTVIDYGLDQVFDKVILN
ncbi:TPA: preprotein translocase subunit SecE [Candidatus Saccharibacteria bacterium]|nr:preprotein translocase subunit SecE [Candidatus Saccharibacteria bacterium]HIO87361.1 preprotein translocase subunit SecE [Candidatus Saccharibacteria bacterium]